MIISALVSKGMLLCTGLSADAGTAPQSHEASKIHSAAVAATTAAFRIFLGG
ncbi:MAG TPA: hypothetical protein VKN18_00205 [Blastocatellia bacterium]|nr:hypothetical protein [Blastocatellia bacterium]